MAIKVIFSSTDMNNVSDENVDPIHMQKVELL